MRLTTIGSGASGETLVSAILDAAIEELREKGYAGLTTLESVAQRDQQGVVVSTVGRPAELAMDAAYALAPLPEQIPDTGDLRGDLLEVLRRSRTHSAALPVKRYAASAEASPRRPRRAASPIPGPQQRADHQRSAAGRRTWRISADAILPVRVQVAP
ncbi:MAG: hypothetical protein R2722_18240 [Tessaracoccus sp.]